MSIRAIDTRYKNHLFRSRLEARWAVYFDALGIEWEYEKQGYDLGDGLCYLPDFWLPQVRMWGEVKPEAFTAEELEKAYRLHAGTGHPVLLLIRAPAPFLYKATSIAESGDRGFMDYLVTGYHGYFRDEHRFFVNSGYANHSSQLPDEEPEISSWAFDDRDLDAIMSACSARFEPGAPNGGQG